MQNFNLLFQFIPKTEFHLLHVGSFRKLIGCGHAPNLTQQLKEPVLQKKKNRAECKLGPSPFPSAGWYFDWLNQKSTRA